MNRTLMLVGLFWLLFLSTSASHATPCQNDLHPVNPDASYIDNSDNTVTDARTGLMWKRCTEGLSGANCQTGDAQTFTWANALFYAESATFAGYTDWRLPNVKELSSLVEECRFQPSINTSRFPNTPSREFWSSSPAANISASDWLAWYVGFFDGDADVVIRTYALGYVRLVRGGQ